ncbi:hypothetical protein CALVIDRAFT_530040 [Calocera viscosa TUFC12733]|uniref:Uncharacterized protein n=1 Tax=Calocera viscosa (strain TUFC12733) TaxID=1330018 RepID=A0A167IDZ4_CALVF|nr:hypothetical protein CALVIDRAFT_530040 [Calocera viscosa TUFC12733]
MQCRAIHTGIPTERNYGSLSINVLALGSSFSMIWSSWVASVCGCYPTVAAQVAVLAVFSTNHEISSPASILVFFSYFVIIWWVWTSQVLYDVRFQSNDWLHRIFRFLQLGTFAFIGIGSKDFDPSNILPPDIAATPEDQAMQSEGWIAFKSISVAYALSRVLLAVQYLHTAYITRRHKRLLTLLIPAMMSSASAILWLVGGSLRFRSDIKLEICYSALALEYIVTGLLPVLVSYIPVPSYAISERYGALTLVILGEVSRMLPFLHVCSERFQGIIGLFLFHGFDTEFLQVGTFLSIQHCSFKEVLSNIGDAIQTIGLNFNTMAADLAAGNFSSSSVPLDVLSVQFAKLQLSPALPAEIQQIENDIKAFGPGESDPNIEFWQYWGQHQFYDVQLSTDVLEIYANLTKLNQTVIAQTASEDEVRAQQLLFDFMRSWIAELLQGALFFLPCMVFMLIARRADGHALQTDASFGVGQALSELSPLFGLGLSPFPSRSTVDKNTVQAAAEVPSGRALYTAILMSTNTEVEVEVDDPACPSSESPDPPSPLSSSIVLLPSPTPSSYPPPFQSPNNAPPPPTPPQADISFALALLLLAASQLGLVVARYPEVRRRERVAYAGVWEERLGEARRGVKRAREEVREVAGRVAAVSMDDAQHLADLGQAYAPGVFSILSTFQTALQKLYSSMPPLPTATEAREGLQGMLARVVDLERIGEVAEDDLVTALTQTQLRIMARRYAPDLSSLLTSALHRLRFALALPSPPPRLPAVQGQTRASPEPSPPADDWGVRSLPSSDERWAPAVHTSGLGREHRGERLKGAMGTLMPGLEGGRKGWEEEELD